MSSALIVVGFALLRAANNDHWSATVGLALGQLALGAGAWIIVRPILTTGLTAIGGRRWLALLPSLVMTAYIGGVVSFASEAAFERVLLAAYLTLPGSLLDALLIWYEGQTQLQKTRLQQEAHNDHDRP